MGARVFCETLRLLFYSALTVTVFCRLLPWTGAENSTTGRFFRTVTETLCFPLRRLLRGFTDRHPFAVDIPALIISVGLFLLGATLPRL